MISNFNVCIITIHPILVFYKFVLGEASPSIYADWMNGG